MQYGGIELFMMNSNLAKPTPSLGMKEEEKAKEEVIADVQKRLDDAIK